VSFAAAGFAAEYLAQLEAFAATGQLPRVRALHLPPEPKPEDREENKGEFCALELDDGSLGLSYVLLDDTLAGMRRGADAFHLAGADPLEVARGYVVGHGIEKTIGFAAANALTRCLFDRAGYVPPQAGDSIGGIDPQPGDHIGMIGLFKPLLGRILDSGARLTVVELNPELAGPADGYVVTLDAATLATCNKVVSTATLLLNDTLDRMLAACRHASWLALVGPSAGCLPDALFARGVTMIGGSWITDRVGFIESLRSGEKQNGVSRKSAITPESYRGANMLVDLLR
jgi:uncharacterized protein (DUF4213/DUF364 family)